MAWVIWTLDTIVICKLFAYTSDSTKLHMKMSNANRIFNSLVQIITFVLSNIVLLKTHTIDIKIIPFRPQEVYNHRPMVLICDRNGLISVVLKKIWIDNAHSPNSMPNSDVLGIHWLFALRSHCSIFDNFVWSGIHSSRNRLHRWSVIFQ